MSKARRPTGIFEAHYDRIAILSALTVLLGSSIWLLAGLGSEQMSVEPRDLEPAAPAKVEPLDTAPLDLLAASVAKPLQYPSGRKLIVGELRVSSIPDGLPIPYGAAVCPFTGKPQPSASDRSLRDSDGDGIPDDWEAKYGLNPYEASDARIDADGDGFSNLEESLAGTVPNDKESSPPPVVKLRLIKAQVNPFKLRFLGTSLMPNGDVKYQLNLRSLERTYFPRMNEEVEGFLVTEYNEKAPDGPTLTLKQGDKVMRLVQGRVRDESAYTALMISLLNGKRFKSNIGEAITLYDQTYKVVDIREDRVVLGEDKSGKKIEVRLISSAEEQAIFSTPGEPEKANPGPGNPSPEPGN